MSGIPTTVTVSSAFLKKCMNDPEDVYKRQGIGFADGGKEGYEYTPAGQVSRTIDGNGNSVQYRYNSLGKVSERTDQLGFTEIFRYDEEGNLSLHIDRDGSCLLYTSRCV